MIYKINKENYKTFSTFEENRLKPRTYFIPFSEIDELAITSPMNERYYSDKINLLSGQWDFAYFDKVSALPAELDSGIQAWDTVTVPSTWQRTGYEHPVYINIPYPFPAKPPHFPTDCPVGVYRKTFAPKAASRHILTFLGVAGALEVYVNGQWIGYGEGSHNSQEFDITAAVHTEKGAENELLVVVFKWSNGTYLECQDMFRENGIFRDVYITAVGEYDFMDIKITPKKTGFGWELQTATLFYNKDNEFAAIASLYDGERLIAEEYIEDNYAELTNLQVQEWSAEIPALYELYLTILKDNKVVSVARSLVGFKTVTIDGEVFKINNKAVKLLGVNHHDTHPTKGYAVSIEDLEQDIKLLKEYNCNAVRTAHYPPDPAFLQMCDMYGLYVIDEADIECHGVLSKRRGAISNNSAWEGHFIDRAKRMVIRDYNRPCVVMWSLGNEAGGWRNQDACAKMIKKISPLPVHYENVYGPVRYRYDVTSRMYTHPKVVERIGQGKAGKRYAGAPFFLCEYGHAMGVGPGSLKEYTAAFFKYPNLAGGCIWEMVDHAVQGWSPKYKYTYGGDHGEQIHDSNFCVDGLFFPDRVPHTGALAVKEAYCPIKAQLLAPDVFVFKNVRSFLSTLDIRISWQLLKEGRQVDDGTFIIDIAPGSSIAKNITYKDMDKGAEYVLRFTYSSLDSSAVMGHDEFLVNSRPLQYTVKEGTYKRSIEGSNCTIEFEGGSLVFDKAKGSLAGYKIGDTQLLNTKEPLMPILVRANIDNDRNLKKIWQYLGLYSAKYKVKKVTEQLAPEKAVYKVTGTLKGKGLARFKVCYIYEFNADGSIKLTCSLSSPIVKGIGLPRFGSCLKLAREFEEVEYYGAGEAENLPDFKSHAHLGIYSAKISELAQPYIKPQESGTHTDMRWVNITNDKGIGITIHADENPFIFNASHYTIDNIISAAHPEDLEEANASHIYIDGFLSGAGSNSCGPQPMDQYKVKLGKQPLKYSFYIVPKVK